MKNQDPARTHKPIRNRILGAFVAAMTMTTSMLTAQLKVTFDGNGDETTPSGTITVNLGDNTAALSNLTGTMGIGAPTISGGLGGLSGSFDISFEALGTVAQNFNPADFTGGAADGVFTTGTEWAGNSDLSSNANNNPGQGIVFTFDFTNLVGGESIDLTAVRWQSTSNSSRLSFLDEGAGASLLLTPGDNAVPSDGGSGNQTVVFTVPQPLDGDDQLGFWTDGSGQKRLKEFTFNFVPDGITPPVNLAGTTDGGKVDLTWSVDQSGVLASYSVFRSENQGGPYGPAIATGVLTSNYSDATVVTGTTYYYVVTATDTEAFETGPSNELEIVPVIQAPTNLAVFPGDMVVDLDWDDDLSTVFGSYSVYRSEFAGGPYETPLVTGLTSSDYSDTSVTNETPYFYVVTAIDNTVAASESENSNELEAIPFAPIVGSSLYAHLDATIAGSVKLDELGPVTEKVLTWQDLSVEPFNDATESVGSVLYPSDTVSPTGLAGLDMGPDRNILLFQEQPAQAQWLDFSTTGSALRYSGFTVFVAVTADSLDPGNTRDVVMSSVESKFRLGYEKGRAQIVLGGLQDGKLENPQAVEAGDTVIIGVNYDANAETVELWDSMSGSTSSLTVPKADFTEGDGGRPIYLGGAVNGGQIMDGMIGEVKVYRGVMTPAEFEQERIELNFKWAGLTAPAGLTATPGDGTVELDWNNQVADTYEVYRDGEFQAEVTESNYTDNGLTNGVTYVYTVAAIKDGEFSDDSEEVNATPWVPIAGSSLYLHLDATDAGSITTAEGDPELVDVWGDLSGNGLDATADFGFVYYPSTSLSPTSLPGLDMGTNRNILLSFTPEEQDNWLDFTSSEGALPYSGFSVFAVVKADSILAANQRDIVMSSTESSFRLGYEGGRPQFWLNEGRLENSVTPVVEAGTTVVLAVNYNAETGNVELWDSVTRSTSTTTVAAADFSNSQSMFLGGAVNGDQYMDGMIGEVKVYRGVMTPSEFANEQTALETKWIGAPVGGYSGWQAANGTSEGIDGDHDFDRVQNGVEFFLGGTSNTTGFTPVPGVVDNGGTLSVTWTKAPSYLGAYGTDYVVETSTTLDGDWSPEASGVNVIIDGDNVTYTFPSPSGKLFVRLRVTGP